MGHKLFDDFERPRIQEDRLRPRRSSSASSYQDESDTASDTDSSDGSDSDVEWEEDDLSVSDGGQSWTLAQEESIKAAVESFAAKHDKIDWVKVASRVGGDRSPRANFKKWERLRKKITQSKSQQQKKPDKPVSSLQGAVKAGSPWTEEEKKKLLKLRSQGWTYPKIAESSAFKGKRTVSALHQQCDLLRKRLTDGKRDPAGGKAARTPTSSPKDFDTAEFSDPGSLSDAPLASRTPPTYNRKRRLTSASSSQSRIRTPSERAGSSSLLHLDSGVHTYKDVPDVNTEERDSQEQELDAKIEKCDTDLATLDKKELEYYRQQQELEKVLRDSKSAIEKEEAKQTIAFIETRKSAIAHEQLKLFRQKEVLKKERLHSL